MAKTNQSLKQVRQKTKYKLKSELWSKCKRCGAAIIKDLYSLFAPAMGAASLVAKGILWDTWLGEKLQGWVDKEPKKAETETEKERERQMKELAKEFEQFKDEDLSDSKKAALVDVKLNKAFDQIKQRPDEDEAMPIFIKACPENVQEHIKQRSEAEHNEEINLGDLFVKETAENECTLYTVVDVPQEKDGKYKLLNTEDKSEIEATLEELADDNTWIPIDADEYNEIFGGDGENLTNQEFAQLKASYENFEVKDNYGKGSIKCEITDDSITVTAQSTEKIYLMLMFSVTEDGQISYETQESKQFQNVYKVKNIKKGSPIKAIVIDKLIKDLSENLITTDKGEISPLFKASCPNPNKYTNSNNFLNDLSKVLKDNEPAPEDEMVIDQLVPEKWRQDAEEFFSAEGSHEIEANPPAKEEYDVDEQGAFEDLADFLNNKHKLLQEGIKYVPSKHKQAWNEFLKSYKKK